MVDGDRVSAALRVDGGRCADAGARDASRVLLPRSIFHGFPLRACAGELCRVRRAVAPQPCAPRSAYSFRLTAMTVSSFIVTPSEKRRRRRWRAAAYNAKIRRILNNLPVFPKKNCTSKTKKFPVRFFAGTVFFWEHREII